MKVSTKWLKDYLDYDCSLGELARKLTMAGLEVEEIKEIEGDTIFDVKVTPNRGDWLSIVGVAREAAPLVGSRLKMPSPQVDGSGPAAADLIDISIDDPDLCGRYVGVMIRNVEIKESPEWMKERLTAAGMRPINNIVDITNYVMLELGQPLHAFDYSLLRGSRIIVRRAKPGESIVSLDDVERKLEPDMLVIADIERPVAIAGVMGGSDSEISSQTKDILLESANFTSTSIRRTSKRLGMVTESSYRFERGVDPSITAIAAMRAAELMRDLAGGEVARGLVDVRPRPVEPWIVETRPARVNAVLGTDLDAGVMADYLNGWEIETSISDGKLISKVPTFRQDITREIDIVEEVGRGYGYENLACTLPRTQQQGKDSPEGLFRERVRRILMSCGGQEVLTHSMVDSKLAELAGRSELVLNVRNPLSEDLDSMRVALIPGLLLVLQRNQAYGTVNANIFEIGKIYFSKADGGMGEKLSVAGAMAGSLWKSNWSLSADALKVDFFLCKGVVESLLDSLGISSVRFVETSDPLLHPTRAAKILVGETEIGFMGEVSPDVHEKLDLRERACVYELDFCALMKSTPDVLRYNPLPRYPALYRHIAVVVSDEVKYESVAGVIKRSGEGMIEDVDLLDVYRGEQIGAGKSSLTISMVFRSPDKTLKDEEVNSVLDKVKEALGAEVGASFR